LRYLAINAGALAVGLVMLMVPACAVRHGVDWSSGLIAAMSAALLGTTLIGHSADGATRWLMLGGLALQPSLILLPVMVMTFARSRSVLGTVGMLVAAAALALQPDRAMTGMLAAGLAMLAMLRADRFVTTAFVASIVGFIVALMRPDTLPAAPFVDQILYSAFDVHALAGVAVALGATLLLLPAILGRIYDAANLEIYLVFGAVWLAAIAAAALGNYPTPIVGYGGSAIIGYVLSLAALPKRATAQPRVEARSRGGADVNPGDHHLRLELA
jgi:cell division protein FtsW (lipid II flippase)